MIIGRGVKTLPRVLFLLLSFIIYFCSPLASIILPSKSFSYRHWHIRQMLCSCEGQHCFKELFSRRNMLPGNNKCTHEYILDLVAQFVAWKCCLFTSPQKWITHTHVQKKKNLVLVFSEISHSCQREYHVIAWEHLIEKAWLILLSSLKHQPSDSWII